ncbi:MAG TPA: hypothetical protein GYA07_03525 [Verrucomicrobia bacterium]|nr:hypothetical protein [Verrucomicrobiota bacterium]HOB33114.1 hypothetical protein [Verrucomicrobiota bacterium]HOP96646.1 hypothetical protein [Verrucomicrobiota bacterium]HPU56928.1 hypothetical protein [Verrucomicrobiota bacterium]
MKNRLLWIFTAIAVASINTQAQHAHLNVGAEATHQDAPLTWANGAEFATGSGYVKALNYASEGCFAGYYEGNITLTVLPATEAHAGPDPAAPALGSYIQFRISCLDAPPGGKFGFWEAGSTAPVVSLGAGESATNLWPLTESDGAPGSDPFGHIHGRRFTATRPGIYKIGFTAVDTSTNGVGGGPIHTPSDELLVWFQAGVHIQSVAPDPETGNTRVRFGAAAGFAWQVESSTNVAPDAVWVPEGESVLGTDTFVETIHEGLSGDTRFFRVRGVPVVP